MSRESEQMERLDKLFRARQELDSRVVMDVNAPIMQQIYDPAVYKNRDPVKVKSDDQADGGGSDPGAGLMDQDDRPFSAEPADDAGAEDQGADTPTPFTSTVGHPAIPMSGITEGWKASSGHKHLKPKKQPEPFLPRSLHLPGLNAPIGSTREEAAAMRQEAREDGVPYEPSFLTKIFHGADHRLKFARVMFWAVVPLFLLWAHTKHRWQGDHQLATICMLVFLLAMSCVASTIDTHREMQEDGSPIGPMHVFLVYFIFRFGRIISLFIAALCIGLYLDPHGFHAAMSSLWDMMFGD